MQENTTGSAPIEPSNLDEAGDLDFDTKAGFQTALQKKAEALKEAERAKQQMAEELAKLREEKKRKALEELDESERLKVEKEELAAENAKLKLSQFVAKELSKRSIDVDDPVAEIALEAPWAIPTIKRNLGDSPTWAEVIEVVETRIPAYLDSLVSKKKGEPKADDETPSAPTSTPSDGTVDAERVTISGSKRIWSRNEIANLDDATYLKHRDEIRLAEKEGRIV